jgi:hypothetical protein
MDQYADGSGTIDPTDAAAPAAATVYNPRLVGLRAGHLDELQNPQLRSFAVRALLHEGGQQGLASNFEQLSNYANARGMGLKQALTSGFYGPVNNGTIQSGLSPQEAAAGDAAINSVFNQGRNKIGYRIDQGMRGDPNYAQEASDPRFRLASIDGTHFSDHPSVGVGWAQQQLALDKAAGISPDSQFEATGSPIAAINNAAGIKTPSGKGALAFSGNDDSEDEDSGALSADKATGGKGALKTLFEGEDRSKASIIGATLANVGAALAGISNPNQAQALRGIAKDITENSQSKYQTQVGFDGTVYRKNINTGEVQAIQGPGAAKGNYTAVPYKDPSTGQVSYRIFDHNKGVFLDGGGGKPQPTGPQPGGDPELTGQDRFNSMGKPDQIATQAIIDGRDPRVLSSMSLKNNPELNAHLKAAQAVDENLDMNKVKNRATYWSDLGKASPSSWGGIIRRSGIAIDQLDKSIDNMGRLGNTSSALGPTASSVENRMVFGKAATAREAIVKELGTNAQNASTDINALQQGQHGTGAERDSIKGGLNLPNEAPELQAAAAQAHLDALRSVVQRAKDAEEVNVGKGFIDKDPRWAEYDQKIQTAQAKLDKLKQGDFSYVKGGKAPAAPAANAAPAAAAPAQPTFQEGMTATNPKTGAKAVFKNGNWVPIQ